MAVSGETARLIDEEARSIIDDCYGRSQTILRQRGQAARNVGGAHRIRNARSKQIDDIMEGMSPRPPQRPATIPERAAVPPPATISAPSAVRLKRSDWLGRWGPGPPPSVCPTGIPSLSQILVCGDRELALDRVAIMGVLNLTPDSFSDGGELLTDDERLNKEALLRRADVMVAEGAAILDLGAESTRPGAKPVSLPVERDRIVWDRGAANAVRCRHFVDSVSPSVHGGGRCGRRSAQRCSRARSARGHGRLERRVCPCVSCTCKAAGHAESAPL